MKTKGDDIVVGQAYFITISTSQGTIEFRDHVMMINEKENEIIFGEVKTTGIQGKYITARKV